MKIISFNSSLVLISFIFNVYCKDFRIGLSSKQDQLVSFEKVYRTRSPYWHATAQFRGTYQCPISYVRVVNVLSEDRAPKIKVIKGGLHEKNIVLTLVSPYNQPLSVNIYVTCQNGTVATSGTQKERPSTSVPDKSSSTTRVPEKNSGKPSAPQTFSIVTMNEAEGYAELKWEKPLDDGGAPITTYIIEYRVKGTEQWTSDKEINIPGTNTTATQKYLNLKLNEYEFRVKAANMIGEGLPSEIDYVDKPPGPSSLELEDISVIKNTAHLKWSIQIEKKLRRDIDGFLIEYRDVGDATNVWNQGPKVMGKDSIEILVDSEEWPYSDGILDMNKNQYEFRVKAFNMAGHGPPSNSVTVGKPTAPKNFTITQITEKDNGYILKVTWTIPDSDGGKPIQNYNIQQRSGVEWEEGKTVPGSDTSATLEVTNGSYEFRVRARNMLDYGPPSNVDWAEKPTAPKSFEITNITEKDNGYILEVTWKIPDTDGGKPIQYYNIQQRARKGDGQWESAKTVPGSDTSATLEVADDSNEFRVRARNMLDYGPPSNVAWAGRPSAPPTLSIVTMNEEEGSAELKWEKPLDDGGSTITKYIIEYRVRGSVEWTSDKETNIPGTNTSAIQKYLNLKLHEYEFRVKAANMVGEGAASQIDYVDKPPKPSTLHVEDISVSKNTAHLKWSIQIKEKLRREIDGFLIEYREVGDTMNVWKQGPKVMGNDSIEILVDSEEWSQSDGTLDMGTNQYEFRVKAFNIAGHGPPSDSVTVGKPIAPQTFSIVTMNETEGSAEFKWEKPLEDGGAIVTKYIIEYRVRGTEEWTSDKETNIPGTDTNATQKYLNLTLNEYEFRVKAANMAGEGPPSPMDYIDKPPMPSSLEIENISVSKNTAHLKWSMPIEKKLRRDIDGFLIEYRNVSDTTDVWKKGPKVMGNDSIEIFVDSKEWSRIDGTLDMKTNQYEFRVKAFNIAGHGPPSESVTFGKPTKPKNLNITKISRKENGYILEVTWEIPDSDGGKPIQQYNIQQRARKGRGEWKDGKTVPGSHTNATLEVADDSYEFRVRARNMLDYGPPSNVVWAGRPSAPQNFSIVSMHEEEGSAALKWEKPIDDGGVPITRYIIEYRVRGTEEWTSDTETYIPGNDTNATKKNLNLTLNEYVFRVKAANMVGEGPASQIDYIDKPPKPLSLDLEDISLIDNTVHLKWSMQIKKKLRRDIDGFLIEYREVGDTTNVWKQGPKVMGNDSVEILVDSEEWLYIDGTLDMTTKQYEFRVKAFNMAGHGPPSGSVSVGRPSAPQTFVIVTMNEEKGIAVLKWKKPLNDGGANITNYIIEYRVRGTEEWTSDIETNIPGTNTTAMKKYLNLKLHEYEFRVKAANMVGEGAASQIDYIDKPPKPSSLALEDVSVSKNTVHLKWSIQIKKKLRRDIDGFLIEYRDVDDPTNVWQQGPQVIGKDTKEIFVDSEEWSQSDGTLDMKTHQYEFRVKAFNIAGHGPPSNPVSFGKPTMPKSFQITKITQKVNSYTVEVTWKIPDSDGGKPIQNYNIQQRARKGGGDWVKGKTVPGSVTSATLEVADDSYEFRVRARNMLDYGPPSNVAWAGRPSAPQTFSIVTMDEEEGSAELRWEKPLDDGNTPITKYIIEYRVRGTEEWTSDKETNIPGSHTTATQKNLNLKLHEYEFRVKAVNMVGEGPPSDIDYVDKPPKPSSLDLKDISLSENTAHLKWSIQIKNKFRREIDGFLIEYREVGNTTNVWKQGPKVMGNNSIEILVDSEEWSQSDGTLDMRTKQYEFRVKAFNMAGHGPPSGSVTIAKPSAPQTFSIVTMNEEEGSAELKWEKPIDDGGATISKYIIEYRVRGSDEWTSDKETTIPGNDTTATQKYLNLKLHEYVFRVKAVNMAGEGRPSQIDYIDKPPKPSSLAIEDISLSKNTAHLKWSIQIKKKLRRDIEGFLIEYRDEGDPTNVWKQGPKVMGKDSIEILVDSEEWSHIDGTLDMTTNQYEFRVKAFNIAGHGPPSDSVTFGKPTMPINFQITNMTEKDNGYIVEVTWEMPESDGGKPIQDYNVQQRARKGGREWEEGKTVPGSDTSATLEVADDSYEFRVRARNMLDYGPPSNVAWADKPGAPKTFSIITMNEGVGSADLKWEKPLDDGGVPITKYIIEYRIRGSEEWTSDKETNIPGNDTTATQKNLNLKLNEYEFRVKAANMVGEGPPSPIDYVDKPPKPSSLDLEDISVSKNTAHLKWSMQIKKKLRRDVDGFLIEYIEVGDTTNVWKQGPKVMGNDSIEILVDSEEWSHIDGTLDMTTNQYEFRVKAFNIAGHGPPSGSVTAGRPDTPQTFSIVTMNEEEGTADLKWEKPLDDGGAKITKYIIEYRVRGTEEWTSDIETNIPGSATSATQKYLNLKLHEYEFRVKAANMAGEGPPSQIDYVDKPPKPDSLDLVDISVSKNTAHLKWSIQIGKKLRRDIDGFLIEYKEVDDPTNVWQQGPKVMGKDSIEILVDSEEWSHGDGTLDMRTKQYEFRVKAFNIAGHSPPSGSVTISRPSAPRNFAIVNMNTEEGFAEFEWEKPLDDGGAKITKYIIEYRVRGTVEWKSDNKTNIPGTDTTATQKYLNLKLHEYEFRVKAANMAGEGAASQMEYVVRLRPPESFTIVNLNYKKQEARLEWKPPKVTDTTEFNYLVEYRPHNTDSGWELRGSKSTKLTIDSLSDMRSGTVYEFRVSTKSTTGISKPSEIIFVEKPSAPKKLRVADMGKTEALLRWERPENTGGRNITNYIIKYRVKDSKNWEEGVTVDSSTTQAIQRNLNTGKNEYEFHVVAENMAGVSAPSNIDYMAIPSAPRNLKIVDISSSEGTAHLRWEPPKEGAEFVKGYRISLQTNSKIWKEGPTVWGKDTLEILKTNEKWSDFYVTMFSKQKYEFLVRAFNGAGLSEFSNRDYVETPSEPRAFTLSKVTGDIWHFSWQEPRIDGGQPVIEYEVQYKSYLGWYSGVKVSGTKLTASLTGRENTYHRVRAANMLDYGDPSDTDWAVSPSTAPSNLKVLKFVLDKNDNFNGVATLRWDPIKMDGNKPITRYSVDVRVKGGTWREVNPDNKNTAGTATVRGLDRSEEHQYRVTAETVVGYGPSSFAESEPCFDNTYGYFPSMNACYKFINSKTKWGQAYSTCENENAFLWYPSSQDEVDVMTRIVGRQLAWWLWTGIVRDPDHEVTGKNGRLLDDWKTIHGVSVGKYMYGGNKFPDKTSQAQFIRWMDGEPKNKGSKENHLLYGFNAASYTDEDSGYYPFMCAMNWGK